MATNRLITALTRLAWDWCSSSGLTHCAGISSWPRQLWSRSQSRSWRIDDTMAIWNSNSKQNVGEEDGERARDEDKRRHRSESTCVGKVKRLKGSLVWVVSVRCWVCLLCRLKYCRQTQTGKHTYRQTHTHRQANTHTDRQRNTEKHFKVEQIISKLSSHCVRNELKREEGSRREREREWERGRDEEEEKEMEMHGV